MDTTLLLLIETKISMVLTVPTYTTLHLGGMEHVGLEVSGVVMVQTIRTLLSGTVLEVTISTMEHTT